MLEYLSPNSEKEFVSLTAAKGKGEGKMPRRALAGALAVFLVFRLARAEVEGHVFSLARRRRHAR
jgi:hypothetical protein